VPSSIAKSYHERAAEAAVLATQTRDPEIRRACIELAEGWSRLERQHQALAQAAFAPPTWEDEDLPEPAASE
jgi:hypothetical protein